MARYLILLLLSCHILQAQNTDSVKVFIIRPPELKIEGLYCKPSISGNREGYYYFTYDNQAYYFPSAHLTEEEFHEKLIINQESPYSISGSYTLERKDNKAVITWPKDGGSSYLLGKYRDNKLWLVHYEKIPVLNEWNVGNLFLKKTTIEQGIKKHQIRFLSKSIFSNPCQNHSFWGGKIDSLIINPQDTSTYKKNIKKLQTIPAHDIISASKTKITYYKTKFYTYLQNDWKIQIGEFEDSIQGFTEHFDTTFREAPQAKFWMNHFGVKNYLTKLDSNYVWAAKQDCSVSLKFYNEEQLKKVLVAKPEEVFDKLKRITPISESSLHQTW